MKNKRWIKRGGQGGVIFILTLLLSSINIYNVYAQTPTPPPTYTCPTEPPTGTLSLEYYNQCSACIPGTPYPWVTPIVYGTLGPTPTLDLVPTATGTMAPTPTLALVDKSSEVHGMLYPFGLTYDPMVPNQPYIDQATNITYYGASNTGIKFDTHIGAGEFYNVGLHVNKSYYLPARSIFSQIRKSMLDFTNNSCHRALVDINNDGVYEYDLAMAQGMPSLQLGEGCSHSTSCTLDYTIDMNIRVEGPCTVNDDLSMNFYIKDNYASGVNVNETVIWYQNLLITPTPTPDVIDCSVYDYVDDDTPLVDWPGLDMWAGECVTIVPQFTVSTPAVGDTIPAVSWSIAGFSICPTWVDLGTFEIAEIQIPLDILALPALMYIATQIFRM